MSPRSRHHSRIVLRTAAWLISAFAHVSSVHAGERGPSAQASDQELLTYLEELTVQKPNDKPARIARLVSVAKLLANGHGDEVTDSALATFELLASPARPVAPAGSAPGAAAQGPSAISASELPAPTLPVLVDFTHHRRPAARALAVHALASVAGRDPKLRQRVASALGDTAPEVRAAAARGLESLRATEATPLLLRAFERGVPEAAVTLGSIGDAASLSAYTQQLTRAPLDVMLSGYERYLLRPELSDHAKLDVVARLEELGGAQVLRFLSSLARKPQPSPALKQALLASSTRIAAALPRGDRS